MPARGRSRQDLWIVPASEALLIGTTALLGWAIGQPVVFTSLGPTVYEMVERPADRSARPYNIIVGHAVGVLMGFVALFLTHAGAAPAVSPLHGVPGPRIWSGVLAASLTAFLVLLLRAGQPAALATTLLIALGEMQTVRAGIDIMAGVLLLVLINAPIRRYRLRRQASESPLSPPR
jgi:CBS domain-containing membrane protein